MEDASGAGDEDSLLSLFAADPDLLAKLEGMRAKRAVERSRSADGDDMYGALGNVLWCGRRVAIPAKIPGVTGGDTTAIQTACTKAKSALDLFKHQVSQTGDEDSSQAATHCLAALDDARAMVNRHLTTLPVGSGGAEMNELKACLTHLQAYLHYTKLSCQCQHSLELARGMSDASGFAEKARLYEQVGGTVKEMATIVSGVSCASQSGGPRVTPPSGSTDVDGAEEDVLTLQLKADGEVYRTFRLVYLAECYAQLAISPVDESDTDDDRTANLAKAVALTEYADALMSNSVYNRVDDYSEGASHSAIGKK
ncbi:unnamed protein product, partial [Symbiodinium microadriaticum]